MSGCCWRADIKGILCSFPVLSSSYPYNRCGVLVFNVNCRKYHSPEPSLYTALHLCTHGLSPSPLYTGTCSVGWKRRTSNVTSRRKAICDSRETCRGRRLQTCIAGSASPPKRCYWDDSLYYEFVYHQNDFEAVAEALDPFVHSELL